MTNCKRVLLLCVFLGVIGCVVVNAQPNDQSLYSYFMNTYNLGYTKKEIDLTVIIERLEDLKDEYNDALKSNALNESEEYTLSYAKTMEASLNREIDSKVKFATIELDVIQNEIEAGLMTTSTEDMMSLGSKYRSKEDEINTLLRDKTEMVSLFNEPIYESVDVSHLETSIEELNNIMSYNKYNNDPHIGYLSQLKRPFGIAPRVTSPAGYRKDPINGSIKYHNATDYGMPVGTPLYALFDGEIVLSENTGNGYGENIKIDCGNGIVVHYAHMSKRLVSVGDEVTQNQIIGYSGNTGRSTGPHLHLGLYYKGNVLDVEELFK